MQNAWWTCIACDEAIARTKKPGVDQAMRKHQLICKETLRRLAIKDGVYRPTGFQIKPKKV